ncbi:hypothetical protein ElP_71940 (plasmid) [Tautonia plasticadhaerens]|uniref:Toprim domain-containing protein n=1 Tax=Tautonia plasticadhaerens TaxID=2527974 RepID=A0A518HEF7_9BACT|nr:hypothetical protein ElP_71940 [Tautonia plasticadhaerens]
MALDKEVLIAMDNDGPGRAATEKLRRDLPCFRHNFFPIPLPHKDFGETPASILREAVHHLQSQTDIASRGQAYPALG